jgi:hypothetical protein
MYHSVNYKHLYLATLSQKLLRMFLLANLKISRSLKFAGSLISLLLKYRPSFISDLI